MNGNLFIGLAVFFVLLLIVGLVVIGSYSISGMVLTTFGAVGIIVLGIYYNYYDIKF